MKFRLLLVAAGLFATGVFITGAIAQTPYYAGKTITLVTGTNAGGVYDLYARYFAQFLPKYIPGSPNIIVQNMAGAGSMIAANFVYNVANPDGLTIGAIHPELYLFQLADRSEVEYDWSRFGWIGSPATSNHLLYMRADSPFLTINHAVKATPPAKCGATATSSAAYYIPKLLDEVIGTNFEVMLGYQTGPDIDLAVERNEVDCRAFTLSAFFALEPFRTWRKNRFVRVLVQTGRKRDPRIRNAPTIYELMDQYKTPEAERNLANWILAAGDFGRPFVMPPNTPAEQLIIIRTAFQNVLKDEAAIAAAKKNKLDLAPSTGDELEKRAKEVIRQPPEIVAKFKALLKE